MKVESITKFNNIANKIKEDKDWLDEVIELCRSYYKLYGVSGSLHVVLDDGNLNNQTISWCAGYAFGVKDEIGNDIAGLMLMMTMKQRKLFYKNSRYINKFD